MVNNGNLRISVNNGNRYPNNSHCVFHIYWVLKSVPNNGGFEWFSIVLHHYLGLGFGFLVLFSLSVFHSVLDIFSIFFYLINLIRVNKLISTLDIGTQTKKNKKIQTKTLRIWISVPKLNLFFFFFGVEILRIWILGFFCSWNCDGNDVWSMNSYWVLHVCHFCLVGFWYLCGWNGFWKIFSGNSCFCSF